MIGPEHPRTDLRHPTERLARLVPVPQFLGHYAQVERDLQQQRISVTQPPLPRRVRLLQDPPRRRRIIRGLMNTSQLMRGSQNVGIILAEPSSADLDGILEDIARPYEVPPTEQDLRPLPGGK
jgi:hypothetical protein